MRLFWGCLFCESTNTMLPSPAAISLYITTGDTTNRLLISSYPRPGEGYGCGTCYHLNSCCSYSDSAVFFSWAHTSRLAASFHALFWILKNNDFFLMILPRICIAFYEGISSTIQEMLPNGLCSINFNIEAQVFSLYYYVFAWACCVYV